jgi:hypothetical protein
MPLAWAIGLSGVLGAGAQIFGAQEGASAQRDAAAQATAAQMQMFQTTQANLAPFRNLGQQSGNMLGAALPSLTTPFAQAFGGPSGDLQSALEKTPGYQFTLGQGLKSVQNSYAAQGLGSSGSALRGAADYATGLADTTYGNQFSRYLQEQQQRYGMLLGPTQIGESAAAGIGSAATSTGQSIGNNILGAGQATAGADIASGNALANAGQSGINTYLQYSLLSRLPAFGGGGGNPIGNPLIYGSTPGSAWG